MKIKKIGSILFLTLALFITFFNVSFALGPTMGPGGTPSTTSTGSGGAVICQLLPGHTLVSLIDYISCILGSSIIGLIFSLAFVYFFWGVVQYVLYPDDEGKKDKGRNMMITGIIALTVMFSVYGLIRIVKSTFGFTEDNNSVEIPSLPQQ